MTAKPRCVEEECKAGAISPRGFCREHYPRCFHADCREERLDPCGFCPLHCAAEHAPELLGFERPDFRPGDVLIVDLPWSDPGERWEFHHWEADGRPHLKGEGIGVSNLYAWPRDYCGMGARVHRVESEARSGKTTGAATTFPAEALRSAAQAGSGSRVGGGKGRTIRVCCVKGCGHYYAGTAEPEAAERAGLDIEPERAGKVPLCRKHRAEALGSGNPA
jgi:hypothetical protein